MGAGLSLCAGFYRDVVQTVIAEQFSDRAHAAAVLGRGSEVLGFDDDMSADHNWTARVTVFVGDQVGVEQTAAIESRLVQAIPDRYAGFPTAVDVTTPARYVRRELGLDVTVEWDAYDWASLPEHRLAALTAGAVFHDAVGLTQVRDRLAYYPPDVWRYLLIAGWWRVHPELNLVGRAGYAGDDLGSSMIAADMVAGLVRLAFLVERRYAPYAKWVGTAFSRLPIAARLAPELQRVLGADDWKDRERALGAAYRIVAAACNDLEIARRVDVEPVRLWDRPFTVWWGDFPAALGAEITDPTTRDLLRRWSTGGVDRVAEILWSAHNHDAVRRLVADG